MYDVPAQKSMIVYVTFSFVQVEAERFYLVFALLQLATVRKFKSSSELIKNKKKVCDSFLIKSLLEIDATPKKFVIQIKLHNSIIFFLVDNHSIEAIKT